MRKWFDESLQGGVILTDRRVDKRVKQHPLPRNLKIAVLELEENDSVPFAGNFIRVLRDPERNNSVQMFSFDLIDLCTTKENKEVNIRSFLRDDKGLILDFYIAIGREKTNK